MTSLESEGGERGGGYSRIHYSMSHSEVPKGTTVKLPTTREKSGQVSSVSSVHVKALMP